MKPRQIPGTGLFVRGTGFDAEQIAGYNRDVARLNAYIRYLNENPKAMAESLRIRKTGKGPERVTAAEKGRRG